ENEISTMEIADKLYILLRNEVKSYIVDKKRIGILLSGGMDSRIVAGILNDLVEDKAIDIEGITAYTWGNKDSRDVIYANRICDLFGWKFKHYTVEPEDLWNNIIFSALNGCEYSGMHLHAIPQIV